MLKIALIGKGIGHSKSPEIYQELIKKSFEYDLIDIAAQKDLPSLEELRKEYLGINITSPYKKYYFSRVKVNKLSQGLKAINCISFINGAGGTNTDYLAIRDIFLYFRKKYLIKKIFILGSGVMSKITQYFLSENFIPYEVISREFKLDMNKIDLSNYENSLVINTCSRDFIFSGKINDTSLFWDYNYSFEPHKKHFDKNSQLKSYFDGYNLLYIQAKYSVSFWNL